MLQDNDATVINENVVVGRSGACVCLTVRCPSGYAGIEFYEELVALCRRTRLVSIELPTGFLGSA